MKKYLAPKNAQNSHNAYIMIDPFTVQKYELASPCYVFHNQAKSIRKYGKIYLN